MAHSAIPQQLVDSYAKTIYRIDTVPEPIYLHIDTFSAPLALLLQDTDSHHAAIVSAYNPFSRPLPIEENLTAHRSLRHCLQHQGYSIVEGSNIDPCAQWPAEKSFFVSGIDPDTAQSIGRQFNQNAIVRIGADAVPRLLLLR